MSRLHALLTGPGAFRLFLAAIVVVQHLSRARFGVTAVMVFFMLSGYWVSRIAEEKFRARGRPVWQFYVSRFLRLWPAFAVAVLFAALLSVLVVGRFDWHDLAGLPLLGTATFRHDPLGVSWSLDIEAQFYLVLPLFMLIAQRFGALGLLLAAGLLLPLGWWIVANLKFWNVLQYLPLFLAGLLIWRTDWRPGPRIAALSAALFLAAGLAFLMIPATHGLVIEDIGLPKRLWHLGAMIWAMFLIPFVAWNVHRPGAGHDRMLGDLSYSLYLTHYPVIAALKTISPGGLDLGTKLAAVFISAIVALLFWYAVDRPIETWRARLFRG